MTKIDVEKLRILLIDDDLLVSKVLYNILSNAGFKFILTAPSGKDALVILKKHKFDIVVLDLALKDISGIVVLKSIKKYKDSINKATNVIILTGHPSVRTCRVAFKYGAADYISKPVKINDLLISISEIIDRNRGEMI